jgi:hypothetical protein
MGLFFFFLDWGLLAEDSATKLKGCQLNVCTVYAYTVYGVLFSPLWLKSEPGWPAISVSTSQQFRVGQIVWFGCLSAISQLASRVGREGECGISASIALHSLTLPGPGGESREGGCVHSP